MTTIATLRPLWVATSLALMVAACGGSQATPGAPKASVSSSTATAQAPTAPPASPLPSTSTSPSAQASPAAPSPIALLAGEPWIAYQGGTGGPPTIRLVRPDGSDDHAVAPDILAGDQNHPDWSHDGLRIAFSADDGDGTRDIWTVDADGSQATKIVDCADPCAWTDDPSWSPDDARIVFARVTKTDGGPNGLPTLVTVDPDGGHPKTLLTGDPVESFYTPRWSPEGKRLVVEIDRFVTARVDETEVSAQTIAVVDTSKEREVRTLLPWNSRAGYPDWSPVGGLIVFQRPTAADGSGDPADIWTISSDGSDAAQVSTFGPKGGWGIQPSWTPDGSTVMFVGEDIVRTHPNVATAQPDGSGLSRLSDDYFRTHPRMRPTP